MKLLVVALFSLAVTLGVAQTDDVATAAARATSNDSESKVSKLLKDLNQGLIDKVKNTKKGDENKSESSESGEAKTGSYGGIIMGFNVENRIKRITTKLEKGVKKTLAVRANNRKLMLARIQTILVLSGVKGTSADAKSDKILAYLNGILAKHKSKPVIGCECDDAKIMEAVNRVMQAHERCQLKKYLENVKNGAATKITSIIEEHRSKKTKEEPMEDTIEEE